MTPAWLHLRGITFDAILGCHPSERTTPRPVVVDLSVQLDISKPAATDSLPDTLNTETLETLVLQTAREGKYNLLETLAHTLATRILTLPQVQSIHLTVEKPASLPHTRSTAVTLTLP